MVAQRWRAARKKGPTTCIPRKTLCPQNKPLGLQKKRGDKEGREMLANTCVFMAKRQLIHIGELVMQDSGVQRGDTVRGMLAPLSLYSKPV